MGSFRGPPVWWFIYLEEQAQGEGTEPGSEKVVAGAGREVFGPTGVFSRSSLELYHLRRRNWRQSITLDKDRCVAPSGLSPLGCRFELSLTSLIVHYQLILITTRFFVSYLLFFFFRVVINSSLHFEKVRISFSFFLVSFV